MRARQFQDATEFLAALQPVFAAQPDHSTIVNTVLHSHLAAPYSPQAPLMVAVQDESGSVLAAALQTPPYPLTVIAAASATTETVSLAMLVDAVRGESPDFEVISGPEPDLLHFALAWTAATGDRTQALATLLLHRLADFRPPAGVPGAPREAEPDSCSDAELIATWWYDFALEAGTQPPPTAPKPETLDRRAERGHSTVLWCAGDEPVAVAGVGAVVDGRVRIGPVYTPPAHRGRHFGSAVTAAAVTTALGRGAATVELFTDADYPTSNNIYRRLGFEPVGTFLELEVIPAAT